MFDDQDNVKSTGNNEGLWEQKQNLHANNASEQEVVAMYGSMQRDYSKPHLEESNQTDNKGNLDVSHLI